MTLAEIQREVAATARRMVSERKVQASYDYTQAMTIVEGVSIVLSGKGQIKSLFDTYPELFEDERAEESAARFRAFAASFNRKLEGNE